MCSWPQMSDEIKVNESKMQDDNGGDDDGDVDDKDVEIIDVEGEDDGGDGSEDSADDHRIAPEEANSDEYVPTVHDLIALNMDARNE